MGITWRSNLRLREKIQKKLASVEYELGKELELAAGEIKIRTQSGQGATGQSLGSYSKAYAKKRQAAGRKTAPVDLTFTGNLLKSIHTADVERRGGKIEGRIYITPGRPKGSATNADIVRGLKKQGRKFFALDRKQRARLRATIRKALGKA